MWGLDFKYSGSDRSRRIRWGSVQVGMARKSQRALNLWPLELGMVNRFLKVGRVYI